MSTQNYAPQNGRPPRPPKFTPQIGVPYQIAITALPGRLVASEFGPSEVVFDLTNGRPWYVPQIVADTIYGLRIQPDQLFEIMQGGKAKATIQVSLLGAGSAAETTPPTIAQTTTSAAQSATSRNGYHNPAPPTPPLPPPPVPAPPAPPAGPTPAATSQLMGCFMQAIDAIQEAQSYANRKGLGITFSSEDVRATAISCWIQCSKGGAR
jgi:hypothetical protein